MANLSMLASDDNNPEFLGAHNPDSKLWVRFYQRPRLNRFESNLQGRPIYQDAIYCEKIAPGGTLNIKDQPVTEEDKARFPIQWQHFMNTKGGDPAKVGTPLEQWPRVTPAQLEMLRALKFYTVESVAMASDDQINSIGMLAGMAPTSFREAAMMYLKVAKDSGYAQKLAEEKKAAEAEMTALKAEMAELKAMLAQATQPEKKRA